jgi:cytochrome c
MSFGEEKAMKRFIIILSILAAASMAMADDGASPARGKELFTGKQLGTSGKSCNLCHPDGKGLEKAAAYDEEDLGPIINQCIKFSLKGNALDPASVEMKSLILYIKTLVPSAPL